MSDCYPASEMPPFPTRSAICVSWLHHSLVRSMVPVSVWFATKALVGRLNEHIRGPVARIAALNRIVSARRSGCLHSPESHAPLNHGLQAVPNDGGHLLVDIQIGRVTQPSMA